MTKIVSFSLPDDMFDELEQVCKAKNKKKSEYLRDCLRFIWNVQADLNDDDGKWTHNLRKLLTRTVMEIP